MLDWIVDEDRTMASAFCQHRLATKTATATTKWFECISPKTQSIESIWWRRWHSTKRQNKGRNIITICLLRLFSYFFFPNSISTDDVRAERKAKIDWWMKMNELAPISIDSLSRRTLTSWLNLRFFETASVQETKWKREIISIQRLINSFIHFAINFNCVCVRVYTTPNRVNITNLSMDFSFAILLYEFAS